jgi:iron complex outermembrane receptor protein
VSTPSRFYTHSQFTVAAFQPPFSPVIEVVYAANPHLPSQKLDAFELGYRVQPSVVFSADIATFYNVYDNLNRAEEAATRLVTTPFPNLLLPLQWQSTSRAESYGAEVALHWQPATAWRITGTYSWLHLRIRPDEFLGTGSPTHQASVRSYATLTRRLQFNAFAAYVSDIAALAISTDTIRVPAYVRVDAGFVLRATDSLELALWGRNLASPRHGEISSQDTGTVGEVPRGALFKITYRF